MKRQSVLWLMMGLFAAAAACQAPAPRVPDHAQPPHQRTTAPGTGTIRLVLRHDMLLARVHINGQYAGFFLIDTGSAVAAVDPAVARQLGLSPVRRGTVTGIGGRTAVEYVRLDDLKVDGLTVGPSIAAVLDLEQFSRAAHYSIKGIIGFNSLASRPFTLDYRARTLTVHDAANFHPPLDAHATRLELRQRIPAVQAQVTDEDPIWIQIDTGANSWLSLPIAYVQDRPAILAGVYNPQASSRGVAGQITDVRSKLDTITLFGLQLHKVPVTIEMAPRLQPDAATRFGRMGNRLLKSFTLTFDYPHRTLWTRFHPTEE